MVYKDILRINRHREQYSHTYLVLLDEYDSYEYKESWEDLCKEKKSKYERASRVMVKLLDRI